MHPFLEIAHTGLVAVLLHPLRSAATVACLVVVIAPYVTGLALSQGLQAEADASIRFGADLYVVGSQFGRDVPVRLEAIEKLLALEGVTGVTPRIVGTIHLGSAREPAVLVGLPVASFPSAVACIDGRLPADGAVHELLIGTELAERLRLEVGSVLPPFYRNDAGEKLSKVVGVFRADVSFWQSRLILTSYESAATIFNQQGLATELLVHCRPGYANTVRAQIVRDVALGPPDAPTTVVPRVTTREDLQSLVPAGLAHREGVFNLLFLLAFLVALLVLAMTTGVGLSERRREIGILKATGWQTDEVLLRTAAESLVLSLAGAGLSLILAAIWLAWFNGFGIAAVFFTGTGWAPSFNVPYRLAPVPALLAFVLALAILMIGSLYATWRSAITPPREAMR